MKGLVKLSLVALLATNMYAGWEDFLKASGNEDNSLHDDGGTHSGTLYRATVTYKFTTYDNNGKHGDAEKVYIKIVGANGQTYTAGTTSEGLTKDELKTWANNHASGLVNALFSGDPTQTIAGQSTATTNVATINNQMKVSNLLGITFTTKVTLDSEVGRITNYGSKADTTGGVLNYSKDLNSGNSWGFLTTYKYTKTKDNWGSKAGNLALIPFYKINSEVNPNLNIATIFNLVGGIVYLESNMFPDGAGYLEYGGGVGVVPTFKMNDNFLVDLSVGYQYSKKYIPKSKVPEEVEFVADAINNLKPLQTLNLGMGATYYFNKNWKANADILHIKQLVTTDLESGRERSTYYTIKTTYDINSWTLGIGYKIVEDVSKYKESAYMATVRYNW